MLARDTMPLLTTVFVLAVLAIAEERWAMAVYGLSFWHYLIYALAFFWRKIPHERFIRDSLLLKTI
ncbi:MAG: hypothetical protein OEU92_26835, partial [Alphaproteobacteria bacterium]|nr:hypothetical protein [Alphaproteobacteria bacterium]